MLFGPVPKSTEDVHVLFRFPSVFSSLPSPSFWGCVCWCSTSSAWSGGPWQRVRATPATSLPFFLTLPPFPLRPSGGACTGAPRPLPGVVAHGRGYVRRQPRPFPSFLSDFLPSLSVLLGVCVGAPRPLPGVVAHGRGCVRRQPRPFPSFLSDSSSLPSPSFWGCVCWCSTSFAWSGGPWQRVRAMPATSLPFLSF